VAQAACAKKEVIKGKRKHGRKRKSATLKADKLKLKLEVARAAKEAINSKGKRGQKCKSATQKANKLKLEVALIINALVPWRALVAQMI
jgi:hypothetical protein